VHIFALEVPPFGRLPSFKSEDAGSIVSLMENIKLIVVGDYFYAHLYEGATDHLGANWVCDKPKLAFVAVL